MEELGGPTRARAKRRLPPRRRPTPTARSPADAPPARLAAAVDRREPPRAARPVAPPTAATRGAAVPASQRKVYDVRDVARSILDERQLPRALARAGRRNMVTGIARLEGRSVGLVANQPRSLGGVIDAAASEKAALFVAACDRFRLPLVVLVDTPGFMPGKRQEEIGVIRHGASLLRAFAGASVPKRDPGPAQGLRRRRDHDELEGPRRRRRLRLARRRDRDHGRPPGGRDRPPPGV